jgi:hypothetical protein
MADSFTADPQEANRVGQELAGIRSGLDAASGLFAGAEATGSRRIQRALQRFRDDSSDSRAHMGDLLERASGLLFGLADGTTAVDQALADALAPEQPTDPAGVA